MSYEDEFAETVKKMEPDSGLKAKVMALYPQPEARQRCKKPALKYAACFVLAAAVLMGGVLFQPMRPVQNDFQGCAVSAPVTGFTVVANAATADGVKQTELKPGREFQFASGGPVNGPQMLGCQGDSKEADWLGIYGFQLKCLGSDIARVTYTANRGEFQNLVEMNAIQKMYYDMHSTLAGADQETQKLTPAGGNLAYKPAGAAQTFSPDSDGVLYLKLTMHTDYAPDEDDMKLRTKYDKKILDGTEIKIAVTFRNGTQSTKTVRLSYPETMRDGGEEIAATVVPES